MPLTDAAIKKTNSTLEKRPAALISHRLFTETDWGPHHPLGIGRHKSVVDLCQHLGWLEADSIRQVPPASLDILARLHDEDYICAFRAASAAGKVSRTAREKYKFGTMENPIFAHVFARAAATVSGAIHAAELALEGYTAFHPAGGTHHGKRDKASGFCYFNDPAFAILTFLDAGLDRVMYVDLDAHHGDGVEAIFADEPRVFMISIHEENRWPHTGALTDRGCGNVANMPVPKGFHDAELQFLLDEVVFPQLERFKPQAVVMTCGADPLHGDPLSGMELSNGALWTAIERIAAAVPAAVALGGGGYNPWTVARFWAGLWGRLAGYPPASAPLPPAALELLKGFSSDLVDEDEIEDQWLTRLDDLTPSINPVRNELTQIASAVMQDLP